MITFKSAVAVALVAASGAFAGVGIQAEIGTMNISDYIMANYADALTTKIGLRFSGSGPAAFDFLLGFGYKTEVPFDTASFSGDTKYFNIGATFGLSAKVHNSEKTSLSFLARYTITSYEDGDAWEDVSYGYHFEYYTMILHTMYLGLEPCFKLNEHMELFSNYGISIKVTPNSKAIAQAYPGDPWSWQERKDGTTSICFSGILLGFRYNL